MRLKEDNTSWRSSAIVHRDNRHDHGERRVSLKGSKNKRKWCRGKVGRQHNLIRFLEDEFWFSWGYGHKKRIGAKCTDCGHVFYGKSWKRKTNIPLKIVVDYQCDCRDGYDHIIEVRST